MESTNYYAVPRAPLSEIKLRLESAKLTALIADQPLLNPADEWVVVEVPRILGCSKPGDYSTFGIIWEPWLDLLRIFETVLELSVAADGWKWALRCSLFRAEKLFEFSEEPTHAGVSALDHEYLETIFRRPVDRLLGLLKPGKAIEFCAYINLPYFEMEMQDKLANVLPRGTVVFSSEISD